MLIVHETQKSECKKPIKPHIKQKQTQNVSLSGIFNMKKENE